MGWVVKMSAQAHVDLLESCTGSLVFGGCALGLVLWIVLRTITTFQSGPVLQQATLPAATFGGATHP